MRIIGGHLRGLRLADVGIGDVAAHLRPTTDRVREAIFNLLINAHSIDLKDCRVLDLFAGTGALGLEALSRGAAEVAFVDTGRAAQALIRKNIATARATDQARLLRADVRTLGPNRGKPFDIIFMDPPYNQGLGQTALKALLGGEWMTPEAVIVIEDEQPPVVPPGITVFDQRRYGRSMITLARPSAREAGTPPVNKYSGFDPSRTARSGGSAG